MTDDRDDRRLTIRAIFLAAPVVCAFTAITNSAFAADPSPALRRLADYQLEPTTESLAAYLASLHPTPEREKELRELVARLGDNDFARREDAMRQLTRQVSGIAPLLAEAMRGDNAEIRWRAKVVLDETERESRARPGSCVRRHSREKDCRSGGTPLSPCCRSAATSRCGSSCAAPWWPRSGQPTRACSGKQIAAGDAQARIAAIVALAAVLGPEADDDCPDCYCSTLRKKCRSPRPASWPITAAAKPCRCS